MHHVIHIVFSTLIHNIFRIILAQESTSNLVEIPNVNDIAESLIQSLGVATNGTNITRIEELREKLKKINSYAVDKDKFAVLLSNVTMETNLNETNFYKALNEDDNFKFLLKGEPKNLYLQLKERMNRDDILKIIKKGCDKKIVKSARKAMGDDYFGATNDEDVLDVVVDKLIAEVPHDNHTFDVKKNESMYWDPQNELDDLKEYHQHDGRRIYKGERTTVRYYPFMVSIHVMGRFWCGGVIYWNDLVLTSAACLQLMHNNRFFRENPKVLQVRVGSNHSRLGGEVVDALEVYFHPSYNPRTLSNNIAIIRLRRLLKFNYHRIPKTITISHSPGSVPASAEVLLLGWGVTKLSQRMSYEPVYLQRKFLPVYPNNFCKEVYGEKFISNTMFCAGTFTTGEGACDHDAGGPAIMGGKLVGIISFGPTVCGYPNAPTVFTLVGAFSDWIETVNETMPSYYRGRLRSTTTTRKPLFEYLGQMLPRDMVFDTTTTNPPAVVPYTFVPPSVDASVTTTPSTTTAEGGALRYLKEQFSDEDSWGDRK